MVQILPREDFWGDLGRSVGGGLGEGYLNRADEMALQKAMGGLSQNAGPRDVLNALVGSQTYSPQTKQNFLKNYLGVAQFEELQRHAKELENDRKATKVLKDLEENQKRKLEMNDSLALIDNSGLEEEKKQALREQVKQGDLSKNVIEKITKPNKEDIKHKEEEKAQEITQKAFNDIVALTPKVGRSGIITSKLGGDTSKAYSEFTSLTGALESLLVEKVNRGALSNARFRYITETLLPKPSDSQADIYGKLQGLATILGLDSSALQAEKTESSRPPLSSFKKG